MAAIQQKFSNAFYAILSLPATAMGFALCVQISALSWILSTQYKLDIHEVGIVWAAGPIAGIIGQLLVGIISDKVWFWGGRRRPFILIGGTIAAISLLALTNLGGISEFSGISLLAVAIMVALTLDLSINISFNPTRSIIADVTPEGEKRTKGYTWMQTVSGMFGVLAYAIGAWFGNYTLIYFGIALVFFFSVIPVFFIREPVTLTATSENPKEKKHGTTELHQLYRIYLAHGFCWLGIQTMFVYMFFHVKDTMMISADDQAGQVVSLSFLVLNTVGFILPATVLEPLAKKIGRVKVHVLAIGFMAAGYLLITLFGTSVTLVYVFMGIAGIGWAATVSLPFAIMTEKVDKSRMGLFMGIFNLSVVIPQLIVSLGFGSFIQQSSNKNIIFIICTICLAISTILWSLVKDDSQRDTKLATPHNSSR